MEETRVSYILKQADQLSDRKFARQLRKLALNEIIKNAEEFGILQHPTGTPTTYPTREFYTKERGGEDTSMKIYDTNKAQDKADNKVELSDRSLSTRYSPDRIGVQARRISDGVYQDPITNKTYDWNEGFTTEDGETFQGGRVSLQTELFERK